MFSWVAKLPVFVYRAARVFVVYFLLLPWAYPAVINTYRIDVLGAHTNNNDKNTCVDAAWIWVHGPWEAARLRLPRLPYMYWSSARVRSRSARHFSRLGLGAGKSYLCLHHFFVFLLRSLSIFRTRVLLYVAMLFSGLAQRNNVYTITWLCIHIVLAPFTYALI